MFPETLFRHFNNPKRAGRLIYVIALFLILIGYELQTSFIQSWFFSHYADMLQYSVGNGPSPRIVFPSNGPFDLRRGYVQIPAFVMNLEQHGYEIARQARFNYFLAMTAKKGISPPYKAKSVTGLTLSDKKGKIIYESIPRDMVYLTFEEIPEDVIKILLFIENRGLLTPPDERQNPVLEWDRMAVAGFKYVGNKVGVVTSVPGGSTLATQLEKYQHHEGGMTHGPGDKIRQMTSASLKVYMAGEDTTVSRKEIITDYINTVPLASVRGYGEVTGLGEGLKAWFDADTKSVSDALGSKGENGGHSMVRAGAFKKVMALLLAVKAPTQYLVHNRTALLKRVNIFIELMYKDGEIDKDFRDLVKSAPLDFRTGKIEVPGRQIMDRKSPNSIRYHLLKVLGLPGFYDLDRLDLDVKSTMDAEIQTEVSHLLLKLGEKEFVEASGLMEERMLKRGNPRNVIYSFLLYEKTGAGNVLRVQADNLGQPLDINEGVKLELGSTAKLRTLAHYLQIISQTYNEVSGKDKERLINDLQLKKDPISIWMTAQFKNKPDITLSKLLEAAMHRKYRANPNETFFTGGGEHTFGNFRKEDNGLVPDLYEGLQNSVNLVFIRLMRDIVQYHAARLEFDTAEVLKDPEHPARRELLEQINEKESRVFLSKFTDKYRGLTLDQSIEKLLGNRSASPRHLSILFFSMHPDASADELAIWLNKRLPGIAETNKKLISRLAASYGKPHLSLSDYSYLLSRHPLELWTIGYLSAHPQAKWKEILGSSTAAREDSGVWLFSPRNKRAQDRRLRILFEEKSFTEIHRQWKKLGYPFGSLVPSYATSIGSSADKPSSLAELMGIIINDGVRMPVIKVTNLVFAKDTPYETELRLKPSHGERVMPAEAALILRKALAGVVEKGTAKRVRGVLNGQDEKPVVIGGKTGSGDNRLEIHGKGGKLISSRVVNRTATFVFYIDDRYFGVLTAFMPGREAADYSFTSSLTVQIFKILAPVLKPLVVSG